VGNTEKSLTTLVYSPKAYEMKIKSNIRMDTTNI